MNNLLRRTLPLRADKNFGHPDLLSKIPGGDFGQYGTLMPRPHSFNSFNANSSNCYQG